jgi:DNA-binding GntR family transcriptional regulator
MHKLGFMQNLTSPIVDTASTVSEQAFMRLRRDVLQGAWEPESRLKVDELQGHYGFSSSPLREALSRLAQEGLVRADERRGFRVAPISMDDLDDITRMRLMLDVPALQDAIVHGDDSWEAGIVAASHRLERVESRLADGPVVLDDDWSSLHRDFHMCLLAACTSERQRAWSASLFDQAERYRRFSARNRQTVRRKSDEHKRLMNAVLARDGDTAAVLLAEHIEGTRRNVRAALKKMAQA